MTSAAPPTLTLRLPNRLAAIGEAAEKIAIFSYEHGVPGDAIGRLNQALDEALTNTINYGWSDGGEHEVTVVLVVGADAVEAEISDDGAAFDPLQMPPPDLDSDIEARPVGGLGVYLVKVLMDSVAYRRDGGRNVLTLRKSFVKNGNV